MSQPLRAEFRSEAIGFNYPDPEVFVRSQWRCQHYLYLIWRGLWLLWHVAITLASAVNFWVNIAHSTDGGVKWFIYYPHITFLVTVVACTCDLIGSLRAGPLASRPDSDSSDKVTKVPSIRNTDKEEILFRGEFTVIEGLKEAPTPRLSQITWFLYSIVNASNILSTAWFWAVTFDSHTYAVEMVAHVTNSVFVISNLLVSAMPVRLLHFFYPAIYTCLYIAFTGIYRGASGSDVNGRSTIYRPLDWNDAFPTALTVVVGLLVVVPLLHCVTFAAYTFRVYLHARFNSASYAPSAEFEAKVSPVRYRSENKTEDREQARARLKIGSSTSIDIVELPSSSFGGEQPLHLTSTDAQISNGARDSSGVIGNEFNNPT